MEVIGLIGGSGTGKSHHALTLARDLRIDAIIDDGLLIAGNKILAGRSAKAESTRMAAVRRAIFQDPIHANEVRQALALKNPGKLLVLGTSKGMLLKIREALQLTEYSKMVRIEELSSEEEMQQAQQMRYSAGTHVIPVARSEVRRLIPVALVDAFDIFMRNPKHETARFTERTLVKPHFSGKSDGISFDLDMVRPLIEQAVADSGSAVYRLNQAHLKPGPIVQLELAASGGGLDLRLLNTLQQRVCERIQGATGRRVQQVDLRIEELFG